MLVPKSTEVVCWFEEIVIAGWSTVMVIVLEVTL